MTDTPAPASSEAELRALLDRLERGLGRASATSFGIEASAVVMAYRALKERKGWT